MNSTQRRMAHLRFLYKIPTDPLEGPAMRIRARRREHAQEVQNRCVTERAVVDPCLLGSV
jgi:hypothetical protein